MIKLSYNFRLPISVLFLLLIIHMEYNVSFGQNLNNNQSDSVKLLKGEKYFRDLLVPGNALEIIVFPDSTSFLNNIYPIDDQGNILLPILGKVNIMKKSYSELTNFLVNSYSQYLKYPFIQVKPLIRISILGGVQRPGMYYIDPTFSLWHLIRISGGPLEEDGLKKMRWERDRKTVRKDLIPLLESGQSLLSVGFKSGDQIWVPSPTRPSLLTKINRVLPLITFGVTAFTIYLYFQFGRVRRGL